MVTKQIWNLNKNTLEWVVQLGQVHHDNCEMSGLGCDTIVDYGVAEDGTLALSWSCYFPTLRTIPNDTHATLEVKATLSQLPQPLRSGKIAKEFPIRFVLDGTMTIESRTDQGLHICRQFLPASQSLCSLEIVTLTAREQMELTLSQPKTQVLGYTLGTKGVYISRISHNAAERIVLQPGESYTYTVWLSAATAHENCPQPAAAEELEKRYDRITALCDESLVVDTGIEVLDAMIRFAKLRAGESIFETLTGKYHSPGGRTYYAAVWCNDQVEYAGPHFAMTGDKITMEASLNAYRAYIPYMADNYAPIPSSVIAEGLDIWNGAGDRGDAAMYLYGASLFCLYSGDRRISEELYGPIQWCAEYCRRQRTLEGVIRSDTDELERRIPTDGYANLSTACLCCGGLAVAAKLADALGDPQTASDYRCRAEALADAIETYFGADLHGFHTYRYSRGFDTLRSWICLPLCVGIMERSHGTVDAMLSDWLWTADGMLSCEISDENRNSTIWDRSTLYGLKAAFLAGEGDRVMDFLLQYCRKRLLCDRVPYAVEAYPEGAKRHLSAESALMVRVVTEGVLGIQPESLDSFSFVPRLPARLPHLYLSQLYIAGHCWEIRVENLRWMVLRDGEIHATGETNAIRTVIRASDKEG